MAYVEEYVVAGDTIEIGRYHSNRLGVRIKKGAASEGTSDTQYRCNENAAKRRLRRLINTNFRKYDYHIVLGYKKVPSQTVEGINRENFVKVKQDVQLFLRKLSKKYRKAGVELKYIYVIEIGSRGAKHVHIIINRGVNDSAIQECWKHGRIHTNLLDDTGEYSQLSDYLLKFTCKAIREGLVKQRYSCSRNLKQPEVKKTIVKQSVMSKEPSIKGYYCKQSSDYIDCMGYPVQRFILVKG